MHHRFSLPMKLKIFLAPLWIAFVFEKINKTLQNGFFSHENSLYRKSGAITINSCI